MCAPCQIQTLSTVLRSKTLEASWRGQWSYRFWLGSASQLGVVTNSAEHTCSKQAHLPVTSVGSETFEYLLNWNMDLLFKAKWMPTQVSTHPTLRCYSLCINIVLNPIGMKLRYRTCSDMHCHFITKKMNLPATCIKCQLSFCSALNWHELKPVFKSSKGSQSASRITFSPSNDAVTAVYNSWLRNRNISLFLYQCTA